MNSENDIMNYIVAKDDLFLMEIKKAIDADSPIYIWGNAHGAKHVFLRAKQNGIDVEGFVVSESYWSPDCGAGRLEVVLKEAETPVTLIVAFGGTPHKLDEYKDKIFKIVQCDIVNGNEYIAMEQFDYEWVRENRDNLSAVYNLLSDDFSKKVFVQYLNQKISKAYSYLQGLQGEDQYFDDEIVRFGSHEVLFDCGAYRGRTACNFIKHLEKQGIADYDKIVSFEPNEESCNILRGLGIKKHECIQKGLSDSCRIERFTHDAAASCFDMNGTFEVEITTIDETAADNPVTMITMDIEGEELAAINGAEKTISMFTPKLAICLYHKREHLWEICNRIREINSDYRFYCRIYAYSATELVLYAIPG